MNIEFISLTIISIFSVILILKLTLNKRNPNPINIKTIRIIILLEIFCMIIGKYGANWGLAWWIYYTVPMFCTILLPPLYFKMRKTEVAKYIIFTFLSAPTIHFFFSLLGWKNYMPFINIPSIYELVNQSGGL